MEHLTVGICHTIPNYPHVSACQRTKDDECVSELISLLVQRRKASLNRAKKKTKAEIMANDGCQLMTRDKPLFQEFVRRPMSTDRASVVARDMNNAVEALLERLVATASENDHLTRALPSEID
jgi:hypothetical protein